MGRMLGGQAIMAGQSLGLKKNPYLNLPKPTKK